MKEETFLRRSPLSLTGQDHRDMGSSTSLSPNVSRIDTMTDDDLLKYLREQFRILQMAKEEGESRRPELKRFDEETKLDLKATLLFLREKQRLPQEFDVAEHQTKPRL